MPVRCIRVKKKCLPVCSLNVFFLALVFAFSVCYTYMAFQLPLGNARMPGAGFLPRFVGGAAALLSAGLLVSDVVKTMHGEAKKPEKLAHPWRLCWFVGSFIAYVLVFRPLGYVLATIVFTFILCKVMDNSLLMSAIIAILTGAAFFVVFSLLSVPLPLGVLTGLKLF